MATIWKLSTQLGEASYEARFDVDGDVNRAVVTISVAEHGQSEGKLTIEVSPPQRSSQIIANFAGLSSKVTCLLLCLANVGIDIINECFSEADFVGCLQSKGIAIGAKGLACIGGCLASS